MTVLRHFAVRELRQNDARRSVVCVALHFAARRAISCVHHSSIIDPRGRFRIRVRGYPSTRVGGFVIRLGEQLLGAKLWDWRHPVAPLEVGQECGPAGVCRVLPSGEEIGRADATSGPIIRWAGFCAVGLDHTGETGW